MEPACIHMKLYRNRRYCRSEFAPYAGLAETHQIDWSAELLVYEGQRGQNVLNPAGVIRLVEAQEDRIRPVARRHGRSGLERIDQQHRTLRLQQFGDGRSEERPRPTRRTA